MNKKTEKRVVDSINSNSLKTTGTLAKEFGIRLKIFGKNGKYGRGKELPVSETGRIGLIGHGNEKIRLKILTPKNENGGVTVALIDVKNTANVVQKNWQKGQAGYYFEKVINAVKPTYPENTIFLINTKKKDCAIVCVNEISIVRHGNEIFLTIKENFNAPVFKTNKKWGVACPTLTYWPSMMAVIENTVKTNTLFYGTLTLLTGKVDNTSLVLENFTTDLLDENKAVVINTSFSQGIILVQTATGLALLDNKTEVGNIEDIRDFFPKPGEIITFTTKRVIKNQIKNPALCGNLKPKEEITL